MISTDTIKHIRPFHLLTALGVIGLSAALLTGPYYYLSPLPALFAAVLFVIFRYPSAAFYAIVFVIPFGAFRGLSGEYGFLKIHWILGFFLVLLIFCRMVMWKRLPAWLSSPLWPWLGGFFAVAVISASFSRYGMVGWREIPLLAAALGFMAVTMVFVSDRGFQHILPAVLVWSISLSAFFSTLGYVGNIDFFAEKITSGSFKRGTGGTYDPNNLALMILFSLPFLAHYMVMAKRPVVRFLCLGVFLLNLLGLALTFSRGGALVGLFTLLGILVVHRRRMRPKTLGIAVGLVLLTVLVVLMMVPPSYWQHQKTLTHFDRDKSLGLRTAQLLVGWDAFKARPFLGHGPGTYKEYYAQTPHAHRYAPAPFSLRHKAHNVYLEVLVGTGLVGLALFLAVIAKALVNFFRARSLLRRDGDRAESSLVDAYLLSFLSLLVYLLIFSDVYHKYFLLSVPISHVALRFAMRKTTCQAAGANEDAC